jgi:hypothetical protein
VEIRGEDLQQDSSDFLDADNEEPSELDDAFTEEDLAELEEFADLEAAELDETEADPSLAIRVRVQRPLSGFGYIRRPLLIRQRLYPSFRLRYRLLPLLRVGYGIPQPTILRPQILPGCTPCLAGSGLGVTCC